jgi:hypothetical protein
MTSLLDNTNILMTPLKASRLDMLPDLTKLQPMETTMLLIHSRASAFTTTSPTLSRLLLLPHLPQLDSLLLVVLHQLNPLLPLQEELLVQKSSTGTDTIPGMKPTITPLISRITSRPIPLDTLSSLWSSLSQAMPKVVLLLIPPQLSLPERLVLHLKELSTSTDMRHGTKLTTTPLMIKNTRLTLLLLLTKLSH